MRAIHPDWLPILRNPRRPKILLVTVVFSRQALTANAHPAMEPNAIRISTAQAVVEGPDGKSYPFFPALPEWPELIRQFQPEARRADVPRTSLFISPLVRFPRLEIAPGQPASAYARIDLWSPGIRLDRCIPRLAGPIVDGDFERPTSGVSITIDDGETQRKVEFPAGQRTIDRDDFPDAPDLVLGRARRQTIFGPFPDPIPCWPISRDSRRFYLCEPACQVPPIRFQIGGQEVSARDRPQISVGRMGTDPTQTFTEVVFPTSVAQTNLIGGVSASGGEGLATDTAPITLLRDIGGYELSPDAELLLARAGKRFNFSVFINATGDVLEIVRNRILPQTDLVLTQHLNRIEVLPLLADTSRFRVGVGTGFWRRVPDRRRFTRSEDVWNVIEVPYRRTIVPLENGTLARNVYTVDRTYGGAVGALVAQSQQLYGRRMLSVEAADLIEAADGGLPQGVVELAELTAQLTALPHQRLAYDANWSMLPLGLNDQVLLDDPVEGYEETPMRVVGDAWFPTGPRYILQSEDRTA